MSEAAQGRVIFIMGPTATGKTELALRLHERIDSEIISVDSAMVYRGMDIGTAKPDRTILKKIPYHLVDICDPLEAYSVARFREDASVAISRILGKGKTPILVGGTGLYFRALEQGLTELPAADYRIRASIKEQGKEVGWPTMHARLKGVDPQSAARINENDAQRIQRALEVYEITGTTMSELLLAGRTRALPFKANKILLMPGCRARLYSRIKHRFLGMIKAGFIDEVLALYKRGDLSIALPSMRLVGYRQIWCYLAGATNYGTMLECAIAATRQLAKRQITWFRCENVSKYYDPLETGAFATIISCYSNDR